MSLVLRVNTSTGRLRVEVRQSGSVLDLKRAIEKLVHAMPDNQILKCGNGTILGDNSALLSSYGLSNGDFIDLSVSTGSISVQADTSNMARPKMSTKDLPPEPPAEKAADVNNPAPTGTPGAGEDEDILKKKEEGGKPLFDSFDWFLKERNYQIGELAYNRSYKPFMMEKGRMNKLPAPITLKFQRYRHVDHLEVMNVPAMSEFVRYWRDELGMIQQRAGWLYGYYVEDDKHYKLGIRAVVEAIYEPPQTFSEGSIKMEVDTFLPVVDEVAARLGLERIGWVFTHPEREEPLTSGEILTAGKIQLDALQKGHFSGYPMSKLVTCTISPDASAGGAPTPNAYMVSDLGVALVRDDVLAPPSNPKILEVRPARNGDEMPSRFLERGKETYSFDAQWMLVKVNNSAPLKPRTLLRRSAFPRLNRFISPQIQDVQRFLNSSFQIEEGSVPASSDKFADFHFILFVAQSLGVEAAFHFCDAVRERRELSKDGKDMLSLFMH